MRLDQTEINALKHALEGERGDAYIFGSRIDDSKSGGDIDVLIFSDDDPYYTSLRIQTAFFLNAKKNSMF